MTTTILVTTCGSRDVVVVAADGNDVADGTAGGFVFMDTGAVALVPLSGKERQDLSLSLHAHAHTHTR